jgi:molybdenum-dependent DNA-binding transcriptional regulator ModE
MNLTKIERMDILIRTNATGSPTDFAQRMGMSTRSLFNYINYMKTRLNAPIEYSNTMQSYFYKESGLIKIGWYQKNEG